MRRELTDMLTSYLMGWKNIRDCAEWLAGVDWDGDLDRKTRQLLGSIELLTTEVLEGLRPEVEFWRKAAEFVGSESGLSYGQPLSMLELTIADSTNDRSSLTEDITVEVRSAVEGSQSLNISPLPVSGL
jgi:hypothetical protein